MRADVAMAMLVAMTPVAMRAQSAADGPVLGARALAPNAALKIWMPAGRLRLVAWDRDSIVVRGHVVRPDSFLFSGGRDGMKLGVEDHAAAGSERSALVAYIPRGSMVSVKTVSAAIDAAGVSGWFYSVSGPIHLTGDASSLEVESMTGSIDLDATTPWVRARTGRGHLLLRGAPQNVDVSTISGTLDVIATSVVRGQFGSVTGDIHYAGAPPGGGILELSNHSGAVELLFPPDVSAELTLSSIAGLIENNFSRARRIASEPRSLRLVLGHGGPQLSVRTFRGAIRVRTQ
ncbi:MAG: DUF4097 family beta strand repeat-containing protein [Gemmatimonadaceae bacterium]